MHRAIFNWKRPDASESPIWPIRSPNRAISKTATEIHFFSRPAAGSRTGRHKVLSLCMGQRPVKPPLGKADTGEAGSWGPWVPQITSPRRLHSVWPGLRPGVAHEQAFESKQKIVHQHPFEPKTKSTQTARDTHSTRQPDETGPWPERLSGCASGPAPTNTFKAQVHSQSGLPLAGLSTL